MAAPGRRLHLAALWAVLWAVLVAFAAPAAYPQSPPEAPGMTPEQAARMANEMLEGLGGMLGIDPETLRNAGDAERRELLRQGADGYAAGMRQRMEEQTGMPLEEMERLDEAALRDLLMGGGDRPAPPGPAEALPLDPPPPEGFADGSEPLPVGPDGAASLAVTEPRGREVILVAVDIRAPEIVHRERRTIPFTAALALNDLSDDPATLVLEVIDAAERRVLHRLRPVAAGAGQAAR